MSNDAQGNDPLDFMKGMWGNMGFSLPGMVTPTFDVDEIEKRIHDLKAVEGWLRMNLSMLQMTIQNLEMQKSALGTFRSMSEHFGQAGGQTPQEAPQTTASANPFFQAMNAASAPPEPEAEPAAPADEAGLAKAAMWPWEMMNELNATVQAQLADANRQQARKPAPKKAAAKKPAAKRPSKASGK